MTGGRSPDSVIDTVFQTAGPASTAHASPRPVGYEPALGQIAGQHCEIEVVNTGSQDGRPAPDRSEVGEGWAGPAVLTGDAVPAIAELGRGLKIIDAVAGNLQLTRNEREGTTVEKTLEWLPGAAGHHLFRPLPRPR